MTFRLSVAIASILVTGCVVQLQPEPPLEGEDADRDGIGDPGWDAGDFADGDSDVDADADSDTDVGPFADEDFGFAGTPEAEAGEGAAVPRGWGGSGVDELTDDGAPLLPATGYHGGDGPPRGGH